MTENHLKLHGQPLSNGSSGGGIGLAEEGLHHAGVEGVGAISVGSEDVVVKELLDRA